MAFGLLIIALLLKRRKRRCRITQLWNASDDVEDEDDEVNDRGVQESETDLQRRVALGNDRHLPGKATLT